MGPLHGVRVVEIAGIGPCPFAAMMLADMGAEVLRLDRADSVGSGEAPMIDPLARGRRSVALDLKNPAGLEVLMRLVERADALIEGFRPGVMERLGAGPEPCFERNPRLAYGRMTGWGQEGPMAHAAGHDINYIALAGALDPIGPKGGKPVVPLNLVGDFGGGGMFLAFGVVCAILDARTSGQGQVIDAAMVDGASMLLTAIRGMAATGSWKEQRGTNIIDGGAPYYDTYETADGRFISVGAIEPRFYAQLLEKLGLRGEDLPEQNARRDWPAMKERLAAIFRTRTREQWCELLEGSDVCFAPVLSMSEAPAHPHARHREAFVEIGGAHWPAPAPRMSRSEPRPLTLPARPGQHTDEALADWGFAPQELGELRAAGAIA